MFYVYIFYSYIFMCVCVCVCVSMCMQVIFGTPGAIGLIIFVAIYTLYAQRPHCCSENHNNNFILKLFYFILFILTALIRPHPLTWQVGASNTKQLLQFFLRHTWQRSALY